LAIAHAGIIGDSEHGYTLFEDRRPSPETLTALHRRLNELAFPCVSACAEIVSRELSRAVAVLGSASTNATLAGQVYLEELADLPAPLLIAAIRQAIRGEIGDGVFVPKIAELRHAVGKLRQPYDRERERILRVLDFWGDYGADRPDVRIVPASASQPRRQIDA